MAPKIAPLTYRVEEAAALLGIGRNHCYEAIKRGEIPSIRIGKRVLVPCVALQRLLEAGLTPDNDTGTRS